MIPKSLHSDDSHARAVLRARYSRLFGDGTQIDALGNAGGFSGSQLWRFTSPVRERFDANPGPTDLLLRRWPEVAELDSESRRVTWIHKQLARARVCQHVRVSCPIPSDNGDTLVIDASGMWQVEPWLVGRPLCELEVTEASIQCALEGLFDWYRSTETIAGQSSSVPQRGVSRSLLARRSLLSQWWTSGKTTAAFDKLLALSQGQAEFADVSRRICHAFQCLVPAASDWLMRRGDVPVPLRTIHGDARADHFLVHPGVPVGLIDFGAVKHDCVAVDLARFAGSLAAPDSDLYRLILCLWQKADLWPFGEDNVADLTRGLDLTGTLVAGMRWITWVLADRQAMGSSAATLSRMRSIAARLATFAEKM